MINYEAGPAGHNLMTHIDCWMASQLSLHQVWYLRQFLISKLSFHCVAEGAIHTFQNSPNLIQVGSVLY